MTLTHFDVPLVIPPSVLPDPPPGPTLDDWLRLFEHLVNGLAAWFPWLFG